MSVHSNRVRDMSATRSPDETPAPIKANPCAMLS